MNFRDLLGAFAEEDDPNSQQQMGMDDMLANLVQSRQGGIGAMNPGQGIPAPQGALDAPPGQGEAIPEGTGDVIDVNGVRPTRPPAPEPMDEEVLNFGNNQYIEEAAAARENVPNKPGKLRNILGTIGDAFLINGGADAIWAPKQERRKMGNAMAGFTRNPSDAAERMAAGGYGKDALEMLGNVNQNQARTMTAQTGQANANATATKNAQKAYQDARDISSRLLSAAGDDPEKVAFAMKNIALVAQKLGTTPQELGLLENMTPGQRAVYGMSDMTVQQQEQFPRRDRGLNISQQNADNGTRNADSNALRASRPPAGSNPPTPTEAGEVARIRGIINSGVRLSPGDKATWNKYLNGNKPKRGAVTGNKGGTPARMPSRRFKVMKRPN